MKTIGLIGGMSWESSAHYYRIVNQVVRARLGGLHSAPLLMMSVDFAPIAALQQVGDWPALEAAMIDAARALERGGADMVVICTNTMHKLADAVAASVAIPLLHVADVVGDAIARAGFARVGLLGTAFTMEQPFYAERLARHGVTAIPPEAADRALVHDVIYRELVSGIVTPTARAAYRDVMARLVARGAEAIILGCTEIMLLVDQSDATVPLFDTTKLHAEAAVELALS